MTLCHSVYCAVSEFRQGLAGIGKPHKRRAPAPPLLCGDSGRTCRHHPPDSIQNRGRQWLGHDGNYFQVLAVLGLDKDMHVVARDDVVGRRLQDAELPQRQRAPRRTAAKIADAE